MSENQQINRRILYFLKLSVLIHNHEVAGSIPAPATLKINELQRCSSFLFCTWWNFGCPPDACSLYVMTHGTCHRESRGGYWEIRMPYCPVFDVLPGFWCRNRLRGKTLLWLLWFDNCFCSESEVLFYGFQLIYLAESNKKCIFAALKMLFKGAEHKFKDSEYKFKGVEYKFKV